MANWCNSNFQVKWFTKIHFHAIHWNIDSYLVMIMQLNLLGIHRYETKIVPNLLTNEWFDWIKRMLKKRKPQKMLWKKMGYEVIDEEWIDI